MNKLFKYIKDKFLKKDFIIFCVIGVLNTIVNTLCLNGSLNIFRLIYKVEELDDLGSTSFGYLFSTGISILLAFVISSVFSYFMNAKFTYKEKANKSNAWQSAIAFISRFVLTYVLTLLIYELTKLIFNVAYDPNEWIKTIVNFVVSLAMVPPFFLIFKRIFKGKENKEDAQE